MPSAEAAAAVREEVEDSMTAEADGGVGDSIQDASDSNPYGVGESSSDTIVFLCPNGHKLNCPASMQGKPGKCPHCGAKFLVPRYADLEGFDDVGHDEHEGRHQEDSAEEPIPDSGVRHRSGPPELPFDFSAGLGGPTDPSLVIHRIFNELWPQREQGRVIEVHLRSGGVILPDRYASHSSNEGFAMLAAREPSGAFMMHVVAWDQIERIAVRGMSDLPADFD